MLFFARRRLPPKTFARNYRYVQTGVCLSGTHLNNSFVQLQGNLFRALKEFKRDKISRQNARLSLANSVYDNPSLPRRKLMLSVGGNNYRPPLERSKSAPKLMAIEEVEDDDEEDDEEQHKTSRQRYILVGSVGRRSWLNRNSVSVNETPENGEDDALAICGSSVQEGHEIDESVQENSFKLTPCISRYEEEEEEDDEVAERRLHFDCDKEAEGLEGEIMSYFEKKLNEKSGDRKLRNVECLLDNDDIISQLIRSQPPPSASTLTSSANLGILTPVAASESDEPESMRYQIEELESDVDSDHPRMSPVESDDSTGSRRHYPGKGIQLAPPFSEDLKHKLYPHNNNATDSDSDVSDESGFIEYQDHKYPINTDINKADNSILV